MKNLETEIKKVIRDIPDFPRPGIMFKDLTPILKEPELCKKITDAFCKDLCKCSPDALIALDSRGFWFGLMISSQLGIPMIPVRKEGKLPYKTISQSYDLEYGKATIEMHRDALKKEWKVILHDDLLATGGTAEAASKLVQQQGAEIAGYAFTVELSFLKGRDKLRKFSENIISLVEYK
jgi:adenine phosphoribosyltransferase